MSKNISRREFLKGSAASALSLAAMGMLGGNAFAEATTEGAAGYTPGTYTAVVYGYDSYITVNVTFDETSITACDIDASGETAEIGQKAAAEYAELLVSGQSVDAVTSATAAQTMPAIQKGVQNCIDQAATGAAALDESAAAASTEAGEGGYTYEQLTDGNGGLVITAGDETALGSAPEIDAAAITETIDADVVVVGAGITGVAAARSAAEAGAKVVVIEKNAGIEIHGFQCGVLNSSIQKELGAEENVQEVLHEYQRRSAGRGNMQLAALWAKHSGEVFDWYYGAVENPDEDMKKNVTLAYYPRCEEHDVKAGLCRTFLGTIDFKEDQANPLGSPYWISVGQANQAKAEELGARFIFSTAAVKLLTDDEGTVNGVIGKDADGNYVQVNAAKSVILTTGGFCQFGAGSEAMHKVYAPTLYKNYVAATGSQPAWSPMFSVNPGPISGDTGDGQLMAVWAGAAMDPYADVAMGSAESGIGGTVALCVNQNGERFWNEDMGIWEKHDQLMYQPGRVAYDIIDVNWRDHLPYQECGHRNFQVTDQMVAVGWTGMDYIDNFHNEFMAGVGNPDGIIPSLDPHAGTVWGAETLEELADMIKVPKETFLATVKRYNELAAQKSDDDFGCDPQKLFPIEQGPFFACQATAGPSMAAYAGVVVNGHLQVMRKDGTVIKGLYAAGNCAGGKFSPSYSTLLSGMNHGLGITHGYYAGLYAAGGEE